MKALRALVQSGLLEPEEREELVLLMGRVERLERVYEAAKALVERIPAKWTLKDLRGFKEAIGKVI